MVKDTLQLFAQQLASWSSRIIENGRSPFRKVETYPSVLTEQGEVMPPLLFWINRQSLMAGGAVFLPQRQSEESVAEGLSCVRALGLKHFVTWAPAEIVFWEDDGDKAIRHKTVPLKGCDLQIGRFRDELAMVMNELKLLSVTGSLPPQELPAHYLANLCLGYLTDSLPALTEACRIARGRGIDLGGTCPPEHWAWERGARPLFQLLALTYLDLLADSVQPERLEQAMTLHLPDLPFGLAEADERLPLPEAVAVRLHHLFRRLGQLDWRGDNDRARQTVAILLGRIGPMLKGHPSPPVAPGACPEKSLFVNTTAPLPCAAGISFAGSRSLLAGMALARDLEGLPHIVSAAKTVLDLACEPESFPFIAGTVEESPTDGHQPNRGLHSILRRSWPTRRFRLPAGTPSWTFEFIHLLGLSPPGGEMALHLPPCWLELRYADLLFDLLHEHFQLQEVTKEEHSHLVRLTRKSSAEAGSTLAVAGLNGRRTLETASEAIALRTGIVLALELPEPIHNLLATDRLQLATAEDWQNVPLQAAYLFARTTLGRGLWQIVSGGRSLPAVEAFASRCQACAYPLPNREILGQLSLLAEKSPSPKDVERELTFWLDADLPARPLPRKKQGKKAATAPPQASAFEALSEEVSERVFVDGVPIFPEQYLFDFYKPDLIDYQVNGPLRTVSSFFGTFELEGADGKRLEVEGEETARALILASYSDKSDISLPKKRALTEKIIADYQNDLGRLRQSLVSEAHALLQDALEADRMVARIWSRHPLPPWEEVL